MKECAICGEKLDEHALRCSKGHSVFRPPRGKRVHSTGTTLIEQMLRQSPADYTEDEIAHLTEKITKICRDAHTPITRKLVDTIGKDIEAKHKKREEAERKRREEREEAERKQWETAERIEVLLPVFRGVNDRVVGREDFTRFIGDVFDALLYKHLQLETPSPTFDREYADNQTFWRDALRGMHFESMRVFLQGFHLTEWIPSAPGRYFTREAKESRRRALDFIGYGGGEYLPLGKNYMVLGGVGSVRLKAKALDSTTIYFLCASSNGISHQGIPVALHESEYREVIQTINECGGCYADIVGALRVLPAHLSVIQYHRKIPRYCLFVEDINVIRPSSEQDLLTTVAVTFPSGYHGYGAEELHTREGYATRLEKSWAFCSFQGPFQKGLDSAVHWLQDYAIRYSGMDNPPIVSDFDEHYSHFDNPVEFSISRLFSSDLDIDLLKAYQGHYGFTINTQEVIMGDIFRNITGSTIINKSIVEESFNKVQTDFDEDTARALLRVAEEIAESGNREVAELFAGFNEELQKPEPRKPVLRSLWNGIVAALPSLAQLADVGLKISKLFTP